MHPMEFRIQSQIYAFGNIRVHNIVGENLPTIGRIDQYPTETKPELNLRGDGTVPDS